MRWPDMADAKDVRLRNITTGVVVEVREDKVELLGRAWESADSPAKRGPGRPRKDESEK